MIELIFVIVVIGILSAIAIPRFAATRDDAQIAKGRSDVAAIRSAIVSERQGRLLQGSSAYINQLDDSTNYNAAGEILFDNNGTAANTLLQYGVTSASGNGHWMKTAANTYTYQVMGDPVQFTYTQAGGIFDCIHTNANCKRLTE
jgi:general secretion pathway protein G